MSCWVKVYVSDSATPVEIETEEDGTINLEDITAHFPGATTLKYKSPEGIFRSVKCSGGILRPPGGSWNASDIYQVVIPGEVKKESGSDKHSIMSEPNFNQDYDRKRQFDDVGAGTNEPKRPLIEANKPRDLIVLGLQPTTTADTIKEYFEQFGDVALVQPKKSKDNKVGYAFIRFADIIGQRKALKAKIEIEDREITLRIPDSQQEDKDERKVYVCYHEPKLTEQELKKHFEEYGSVAEVYIPQPWRHFCFVTFHESQVAQSIIGKEQTLNGHTLLIKSQQKTKARQEPSGSSFSVWSGSQVDNKTGIPFSIPSSNPCNPFYDQQALGGDRNDFTNYWRSNQGYPPIPQPSGAMPSAGPPTMCPPPPNISSRLPPTSNSTSDMYQQFEAWRNSLNYNNSSKSSNTPDFPMYRASDRQNRRY